MKNSNATIYGVRPISEVLTNLSKVICFHHNDMDGRVAGELFNLAYTNTTFYECDYNVKSIDRHLERCYYWESIEPTAYVIVDYSMSKTTVERLIDIMNDDDIIIWMDHHKTSFDIAETICNEYPELIKSGKLFIELDMNRCGAMIAFDSLSEAKMFNKVKPLADTIKLVDDYDRWVKRYDGSDYLNTYLYASASMYVGSDLMKDILTNEETLLDAYKYGKELMEVQIAKAKILYDAFSYEGTIAGYRARILNGYGNSMAFGEHIKEYDIVAVLHFRGDMWEFSLFTDKDDIDCSEICKRYGGGGHRQAAGARCEKRPF